MRAYLAPACHAESHGRRALSGAVRRQPGLDRALASPTRNLIVGSAFVWLVIGLGTAAYVISGWSWGDAFYMVILTVFTVGYEEVRPIVTPELRAITIGIIIFGCTGMIFVTGALVQFITAAQLAEMLGTRRMTQRIDRLQNHVIICGFGRIGNQLARALFGAGAPFVILEASEARCAEASGRGYLCHRGDATEETHLMQAGIERARAVVSVLPDDAANVFITLSARSINRDLLIIARGEAPATHGKLVQAGADRVVLPAHIGAERIAELLLFPAAEGLIGARGIETQLRALGLEMEVVVAEAGSPWAGKTVAEIEAAATIPFLLLEVERAGSGDRERPNAETRIDPGDGLLLLGRNLQDALQGFIARFS